MSYMTLGVIGHVDHGKTSLVRALTGIETDRLKEEKERGISIALGYAWLDVPAGRIGIVDAPGHEKFIRTMISGATGIRAVLLTLDINEGVKPQTIEHLQISGLLGIEKGVIAITKCDTADGEMRELAELEIRDYLQGTFLENAVIVFTSSETEEGLEELKTALNEILTSIPPLDASGPANLPIDRAFTMEGHGQVVTGTLRRGRLAVDDELICYPEGHSVRVRELQSHAEKVRSIEPGHRTAVNVRLSKRNELHRGDVLAVEGSVEVGRIFLCAVTVLGTAENPLKHRQSVRALWGTTEAIGRVHLLTGSEVAPGEGGFAQILFGEPVCGYFRERVILRAYSPMATIGGAVLLGLGEQRAKREDEGLLRDWTLLRDGTPTEILDVALRNAESGQFEKRCVGYRLNLSAEELDAAWIAVDGLALGTDRMTHKVHMDRLWKRCVTALEQQHTAHPETWGLPHDTLVEQIADAFDTDLVVRALEHWLGDGSLSRTSGLFHLSTFTVEGALSEAEQAIVDEIETAFREGGLQPPGIVEVLRDDKERIRLYKYLVNEKRLVATSVANKGKSLSNTIVFHRDAVEQARSLIQEKIGPDEGFTPSSIKDTLGMTRKYLIPLLECFDKLGFTRRRGDERVLARQRDESGRA